MSKLTSREDLDKLRATISEQRDPERKAIAVCAGTGCVAYGSVPLTEAFREEAKRLNIAVEVRATGCHGSSVVIPRLFRGYSVAIPWLFRGLSRAQPFGNQTEKQAPASGSLSIQTRPECASTIFLTIARPSPPCFLHSEARRTV